MVKKNIEIVGLLGRLGQHIDVFDSFDDPLTFSHDGPSLTPLTIRWRLHMMDLLDFSVSSHILIEFVSFHWICWTRTFWFLTWRRDGSVDPSACISFCSDWHRRLSSATDSRRLHSSTSSSHAFLVCWAGPLSPLTCPLILLDSFSTGFDFLDLDLFDSLLGGGVAFFFCYSGDLDYLTFYIYEASRAKACCGRPTLGAPLSWSTSRLVHARL